VADFRRACAGTWRRRGVFCLHHFAGKGAATMKLIMWFGATVLAAGALLGSGQIAAAQADRTLGLNCTYAGHEHCGENGPIFGARRYGLWHHRRHRHHVRS
jgi:hypothetical protein